MVVLFLAALALLPGLYGQSDDTSPKLPASSGSRPVEIEVTGIENIYDAMNNGTYAERIESQPFPGNQFIVLFASITNSLGENLMADSVDFLVNASDGLMYGVTGKAGVEPVDEQFETDGLESGQTVNVALPFEVPRNISVVSFWYAGSQAQTGVNVTTINVAPVPTGGSLAAKVLSVEDIKTATAHGRSTGEIEKVANPPPGYDVVTVNIANGLGDAVRIDPSNFNLTFADGKKTKAAMNVEMFVPAGIQPGSSGNISLPFATRSSPPTGIEFQSHSYNASVPIDQNVIRSGASA